MNRRRIAVAIIAALAIWVVASEAAGPATPREQWPGHISSNDLRNGVTAIEVTVRGRKVPCVYAAGQNGSGGWSGGAAITCDWVASRGAS